MLTNDSSNIVKVIKENYEVGLYIDLMQWSISIEGSETTMLTNDSFNIVKVINENYEVGYI